jgi:hypothetical protein
MRVAVKTPGSQSRLSLQLQTNQSGPWTERQRGAHGTQIHPFRQLLAHRADVVDESPTFIHLHLHLSSSAVYRLVSCWPVFTAVIAGLFIG